jgi:hypothetical protein
MIWNKIKKIVMGGECDTFIGEERCIQSFDGEV